MGRGSMGSAGLGAGSSLGGLGAALGTVDWRSMLAHVLGMGAAAGLGASDATAGAGAGAAAGFSTVSLGAQGSSMGASFASLGVFHAFDSSVGTESGWAFSLFCRAPLVAATCEDLPRPPRPPLSVFLPRPRPASETLRPPRMGLALNGSMFEAVVVDSLALERGAFFVTSPHCEMVPASREEKISNPGLT